MFHQLRNVNNEDGVLGADIQVIDPYSAPSNPSNYHVDLIRPDRTFPEDVVLPTLILDSKTNFTDLLEQYYLFGSYAITCVYQPKQSVGEKYGMFILQKQGELTCFDELFSVFVRILIESENRPYPRIN